MSSQRFLKAERLKSRKIIDLLFKEGRSFGAYPFRVIYVPIKPSTNHYPVLFSMSVPKRNFPKAVKRNRLRRLIKEAYRLHKHRLYDMLSTQSSQYGIMLIYNNKNEINFAEMERSMLKMIRRFKKQIKTPA